MRVAIVGGGLSLQEVDLAKVYQEHDLTIAINSTAEMMECDICFTISRKYAESIQFGVSSPYRLIFAMQRKYWGEYPCETLYVEDPNIPHDWPVEARVWAVADGGRLGLSESKNIVHGGNSAYAAFNYAFLQNPKHIGLYGLDATNNVRVGGTSGYHGHLPLLFASSVRQINERKIEVVNHSPNSLITSYRRNL